jgi:hypothetical protein
MALWGMDKLEAWKRGRRRADTWVRPDKKISN